GAPGTRPASTSGARPGPARPGSAWDRACPRAAARPRAAGGGSGARWHHPRAIARIGRLLASWPSASVVRPIAFRVGAAIAFRVGAAIEGRVQVSIDARVGGRVALHARAGAGGIAINRAQVADGSARAGA